MFGLDLSEFALIGIVALLFIGPKDMPVAIRTVTGVIKKGRKLAQEFQGHVEEMIRDAELGEARDQFRQLRSLNVRSQVMRAIDPDNGLRNTFKQDLLAPAAPKPPAAGAAALDAPAAGPLGGSLSHRFAPPDAAPAPLAAPLAAPAMAAPPAAIPVDTRPRYGRAMTDVDPALDEAERAALEHGDPAPAILPPAVAGRLRIERARPPAPRFLPPHAAAARHTF